MDKLLIASAIMAAGVLVAAVLRRRTDRTPVRGTSWVVPAQLDRRDFTAPDVATLVVVFSSDTCDSCAATWAKVGPLASDTVAVQQVSFQEHRRLHDRYGIDAVPTVVVTDHAGAVTASYIGEPSGAKLTEMLAGPPGDPQESVED